MKKQVLTLLLTFSLLPIAVSCDSDNNKYFKEDLSSTNFLNDNYRNYYEIFVSSFYDSDGDSKGDLNGVTAKLNYIKDSGYNGIWLMPIFKSPTYHKYDVEDYYQIDPQYGTMEDLDNLIKEAKKLDIKIILDMVLNHASINNPIFIESANAYDKFLRNEHLNDRENKIKDMFCFKKDGKSINGRVFRQVPGKNFYVEENFLGGNMPEYNLDSEFTKQYFKDIFKFYVDKGVGGFRLDACSYLYKDNQEKSINFLSEINTYIKSLDEDFYIVGECWEPSQIIQEYYSSNIDSFFNFDSSTSKGNNYIKRSTNLNGELKNVFLQGFKKSEEIAGDNIPAIFLDNHDMNRVAIKDSDKTKFYYGVASMHKGSLFTYYGDEIGMNGMKGRDEDLRTYMNWSNKNLEGRCDNPAGTSQFNGYIHPALDEQINDKNSIYNYYKKANLIRNQQPIISHGNVVNSICEDETSLLIIDKKYNNESLRIVINFSLEDSKIYDNIHPIFKDVVGQLVVNPNNRIKDLGNNKIEIPALGILVIK